MNDNMHIMATTKTNMQYFDDIEVVLGLTCIRPPLEVMHVLIKFEQAWNCFVCDFVTFVKMCCVELYMYFSLEKKYIH
jgi:hypothetical protein